MDKDFVVVSVTDTGIGIPDTLLKTLFESNAKTSRLGTSGEKGTGFGLPICKSYMDLYGGKIEVTSKTADEFPDDHGTTFTLRLKRA